MLNIPTQSFPAPSSQQRVSQSGRNKVNSIDLFLSPPHIRQVASFTGGYGQVHANGWKTPVHMEKQIIVIAHNRRDYVTIIWHYEKTTKKQENFLESLK